MVFRLEGALREGHLVQLAGLSAGGEEGVSEGGEEGREVETYLGELLVDIFRLTSSSTHLFGLFYLVWFLFLLCSQRFLALVIKSHVLQVMS